MKLNKKAEVVYPAGKEVKIDEMCVAAHQDDIEFMAFGGIYTCLEAGRKFGGVVVTNGSGSPRAGKFADMTDEDMMRVRREEQLAAAKIGRYGVQVLLNHTSADVKAPTDKGVVIDDIREVLLYYKPEVVYTHNLADKHDTHVGVAVKVIRAIRALDAGDRPKKVIGCEVWRGLDWMPDEEKIVTDVSGGRDLAMRLMQVFESQIEGGKRYDIATDGRRYANATYLASHAVDTATQACYSMDLTPLIQDDTLDIVGYIAACIARFNQEVTDRIAKVNNK